MLSKWQIWDFYHQALPSLDSGLKVVHLFDPWLEVKITQKIKEKLPCEVYPGLSVTRDWLEDRLMGLSLFGDSGPFIITQADQLNAEAKEFIKGNIEELAQKNFLMVFHKEDAFSKKIEKFVDAYKVEPPKFWEAHKLLDFLLDIEKVRLTQEAKNLLMDSVVHDCSHFYYYISLLSINFGSQKVSESDLRPYIVSSRLDQFKLASLFNTKKKAQFIDAFLKTKASPKEAILFFGFILSHIIKLMDPSYLNKKSYKSKYDKEILATAGNWSQEELRRSFDFFERCQLLAKINSEQLEHFLRFNLEESFFYQSAQGK